MPITTEGHMSEDPASIRGLETWIVRTGLGTFEKTLSKGHLSHARLPENKQAKCGVWNGGGWIRQISGPEFWKVSAGNFIESRLSGGPTAPSQPDLTLLPRPPPNASVQTRFWPDLDLKSPFSGQNRVQIRSGRMCSEGVGPRGLGPMTMAL